MAGTTDRMERRRKEKERQEEGWGRRREKRRRLGINPPMGDLIAQPWPQQPSVAQQVVNGQVDKTNSLPPMLTYIRLVVMLVVG
jgi:hypothetical protein